MDTPQRGDIGAFKQASLDATGHMGVMKNRATLIYANKTRVANTIIMNYPDWANKTWVYRRFVRFSK